MAKGERNGPYNLEKKGHGISGTLAGKRTSFRSTEGVINRKDQQAEGQEERAGEGNGGSDPGRSKTTREIAQVGAKTAWSTGTTSEPNLGNSDPDKKRINS